MVRDTLSEYLCGAQGEGGAGDLGGDAIVEAARSALRGSGGIVSREDVAYLVDLLEGTPEDLAVEMLPLAATCARAGVSGFSVAAAAMVEEGKGRAPAGTICFGVNVEFMGSSVTHTVHAEQAAVSNAWGAGARRIRGLVVMAFPCGMCRQFLLELGGELEVSVLNVDGRGAGRVIRSRLDRLLPDAFGPSSLGVEGGLLTERVSELIMRLDVDGEELTRAAARAAARSYAPYTGCLAGVALRTSAGEVVEGRYVESVAFNSSLLPLQAAVSALQMMECAGEAFEIVEGVLVEVPGEVSLRSVTRDGLECLGMETPLVYVTAEVSRLGDC